MRMAGAFIEAGKDFDLAVLPGQRHTTTGTAAPCLIRKRAAYLVHHLVD
jgi:hypothetical protein